MEYLHTEIAEFAGDWTPWALLALYTLSTALILWRLHAMAQRGRSSAVLSAGLLPYATGWGNLCLVWLLLRIDGPTEAIPLNLWTNNLTSLSLMLALPALIWGLKLIPDSQSKKSSPASPAVRGPLILNCISFILFSLATWQLGQDGEINRNEGFALLGLFALWQCLQIFQTLKQTPAASTASIPLNVLDGLLILLGGFISLLAVDGILTTLMAQETGFFSIQQLGLLTGALMLLPNAMLAWHYARQQRADAVYYSQLSDAHICMPLCLALCAIFQPLALPTFLLDGLRFLAALALVHLLCLQLLKELPKLVAAGLLAVYAYALFIQFSL